MVETGPDHGWQDRKPKIFREAGRCHFCKSTIQIKITAAGIITVTIDTFF